MSKLYISMYHYTRDLKNSRYPDIKGLDSSLFREQILFMKEHFHIVTMEEVMERQAVIMNCRMMHCY